MVKAFAASLGELTVHLLGEGEVVLRGPARRGVVDDRLPDPGAFADFGRGVDARAGRRAAIDVTPDGRFPDIRLRAAGDAGPIRGCIRVRSGRACAPVFVGSEP